MRGKSKEGTPILNLSLLKLEWVYYLTFQSTSNHIKPARARYLVLEARSKFFEHARARSNLDPKSPSPLELEKYRLEPITKFCSNPSNPLKEKVFSLKSMPVTNICSWP